MPTPETVPSVNPDEPTDIPDSEGATKQWVDPIHGEMNPDRLSDEGDITDEVVESRKAEEAPTKVPTRPERKGGDKPTLDELEMVVKDGEGETEPEEGTEAEKAAETKEGEEGDEAEKAKKAEAEQAEEGEGTDEDDNDDETDDDEPEADDKGKRPRRRRSRARRQRRALERQIDERDATIAALEKKQAERAEQAAGTDETSEEEKTPEKGEPVEPKLEDFDFDTTEWSAAHGKYTQDLVDYKLAEKAKADEAADAEEAHEKTMKTFKNRETEYAKSHDDYDDVVYDTTLYIPQGIANLIPESEVGPEIAYHLATHQDEAMELSDLSDIGLARAFGRLETKFAAEAPAKPDNDDNAADDAGDNAEQASSNEDSPPKTQPVSQRTETKAPAPVPTVKSGGARSPAKPASMDMDEYAEGRRNGSIK